MAWDEGGKGVLSSHWLDHVKYQQLACACCANCWMCALQLLMRQWDAQMSRDVLAHWLDLMNKQGWIAREQVRCNACSTFQSNSVMLLSDLQLPTKLYSMSS